ncbi:hypothetical protein ElyMa_004891800 [Elysia marginata]|uniref:Uncharacterized protein n=1 Tax=Elysia marginata TaxID=1093978 RepID=A0AAV4IUZ7_9GAST|nr:hypothetical protein ElyMa_004891800 [Elysia marginata]
MIDEVTERVMEEPGEGLIGFEDSARSDQDSEDPFSTDTFLRSIAIGVTFDAFVNLENAEEVGNQILKAMVCKSVQDYSFRRTDQVTTKDTKQRAKVDGEPISIEAPLLTTRIYSNLSVAVIRQHCSTDLVSFENLTRHLLLMLYGIWQNVYLLQEVDPLLGQHHVIDGGSVFERICSVYVDFV